MATFHVELRHFPRVSVRFNQSGTQVGAIVLPWVQDRVIELDGEKWAPYDAEITIVEGPEIPLERLSMGRGWATAKREGTDVTERVLGEARAAIADGSAYGGQGSNPAAAPEADAGAPPVEEPVAASDYPSLSSAGPIAGAESAEASRAEPVTERGVEELLGGEPARLLAAWQGVAARTGGLTPSESLALAERELEREDRGGA
ncbi:MAG TPA: hypothetical protein VN618_15850 [Solirubrobacteraceae bacterium]|nr:hypothetical protein [Solirubrobacteraceae bacterium]